MLAPSVLATRARAVSALASPRITVAFFLLMAAGALLTARWGADPTLATSLPFSLLVINLFAAILSNARFRADLPLLLFHLALLALVALFVVARLIFFDGATILTAGTTFEGNLVKDSRGPLHGDSIDRLRFANEGFNEHFPERGKYLTTYNQVRWWDQAGRSHVSEIGDDRPLILDGYRIYATARRGFSPLFAWQPASAALQLGTVQLPDNGDNGLGPVTSWQLPGGPEVWILLDIEATPTPNPGEQRSGLGASEIHHKLVLRHGELRHELRPGESISLDGGRLTYVQLDSWMGYRIIWDPTEPWLIGSVIVGVASLIWFYARSLLRPALRSARKEGN